jgi:hypothetical protein
MSKTFTLPAKESQKIFRGDTIIFDAAISQGGVALPLTGYLIWFTAKPNSSQTDSASGVIQKTLTSGIVVTDANKGLIRITISPADTAGINADTTYQCDVQIKKTATGEISTVGKGTMKVELDITQSTV